MVKHKKQKRHKKLILIILGVVIVGISGFYLFSNYLLHKNDYSNLSWIDAFNKMHTKLTKEYAFTEWKHIDWQSMFDKAMIKIKEAQASNNFETYYLALHEYLNTIPDGHVKTDNIKEIDDKYIGGSFGFSAVKLSDGSVIVQWVDTSGPAYPVGMRVGARLIRWNNQLIDAAINDVSTLFAGTSATTENLELKKVQYLTRAPIGTTADITFKNSRDMVLKSVTLTAYDDGRLSLKKNYPDTVISDKVRSMFLNLENPNPAPLAMVETKTLEGNIGYVKVWGEIDMDLQNSGKAPSTLALLQDAVQSAANKKSTAIILDIRNNIGGLDAMAAEILGSFYQQKTLLEYQNIYNENSRKFEIIKATSDSEALYIKPTKPHFDGKIIALINQKCVSTCEGIAMGINNLPNGKTLGFYGTNGSFGIAGAEIKMPGGLTVHYPWGQSLNKDRKVQLDSQNGQGGVAPSIRIPMTAENAIRVVNGEDVELEEAVRYLAE